MIKGNKVIADGGKCIKNQHPHHLHHHNYLSLNTKALSTLRKTKITPKSSSKS